VPIAAPSANRFTALSPTETRHIDAALADFVLEGGPASVGIESTVISLIGDRPVLLRPGAVTIEGADLADAMPGTHPSPGMHPRHYAPRTRLILGPPPAAGRGFHWELPADPATAARTLYATLHDLDHMNLDWIAVTLPPDTPEWAAVRDRLKRAAS
jgi:L-threonylcarbamoyladenylate synthase